METQEISKLERSMLQDKKLWDVIQERDIAEMAIALTEWFNVSSLNTSDLRRLVRIAATGKFMYWRCPVCTDRVFEGAEAVAEVDPKWSQFQGVLENDRASYPGFGRHDLRCDSCRCHNLGSGHMPATP